jgi:hypothetical protein
VAIVLPGEEGLLPNLFFPIGHSWLVYAVLWDDTWTDIGGSAAVITVLHRTRWSTPVPSSSTRTPSRQG